MRKNSMIFLFFVITCALLFSEDPPIVIWSNTYGGIYADGANCIQETLDGGFIMTGYTDFNPASGLWGNCGLVKLDNNGNQLWFNTYGGTSQDVGNSVLQTNNGNYVVAGTTSSYGNGQDDIWIVKLNANGTELWNYTFGTNYNEMGNSIYQTNDGGFIISGIKYLDNNGNNSDFWLIKTDSNGIEEWNQTYGGNDFDYDATGIQTSDGGYALAGTYGLYSGNSNAYLVKTDSNGNELWSYTYGNYNDERIFSFQQTSDNGFILAGTSYSFNPGGGDFWIVKTDSNGNEEWNHNYGISVNEFIMSIEQTSDGGYIMCGSIDNSPSDIWIQKTDGLGNVIWNEIYNEIGTDGASSIKQIDDNKYILAGQTNSFGSGSYDMYTKELLCLDTNSAPIVENVSASQRIDGSKTVDIYYDVNDTDGDLLTITLQLSEDGGNIFALTPIYTSGDIGNDIVSGTNKHIIWQAGDEAYALGNDQYQFKVIADDAITVTDIDGNVYSTVQIGSQLWMAENLRVTCYRNGDSIPNLTSNSSWINASNGAYCYYLNNPDNAVIYGALYNWYAVDDARNIAPEGWHVPSDEEIMELEIELGMSYNEAHNSGWRGTNEGSQLAGRGDLWNDGSLENNVEFGSSGFNFIPGGNRGNYGAFYLLTRFGEIWSSSESNSNEAMKRLIYDCYTTVSRSDGTKWYGRSVRCVRD